MSFSFTVAGDRKQVTGRLAALKDPSGDSLRNALADLLIEHVGASELHGYEQAGTGWRQVYIVSASGHSGPQSPLNLHIDIQTPYVLVTDEPVTDEAAPAGGDGEPDPDDED